VRNLLRDFRRVNRRGIKRCFCLTSVCLPVAYIGRKSRTERSRKTKIGTESHVTRTPLSRSWSKVKVTRPLQRLAWERVGREKLLLHCRLLGRARHFGAHREGEGRGAYRGDRSPHAVISYVSGMAANSSRCKTIVPHHHVEGKTGAPIPSQPTRGSGGAS